MAVRTLLHHPTTDLHPTVAAGFYPLPELVVDGEAYEVSLWDMGGELPNVYLIPFFAKQKDIFIFFDSLEYGHYYLDRFCNAVELCVEKDPVMILVGSQWRGRINIDRQPEVIEFARERGYPYFEMNVRDEGSVRHVLEEAIRMLKKKRSANP